MAAHNPAVVLAVAEPVEAPPTFAPVSAHKFVALHLALGCRIRFRKQMKRMPQLLAIFAYM
ncbi:MAG: hypothetical protein WA109_15145 [Bellilinea sp.]